LFKHDLKYYLKLQPLQEVGTLDLQAVTTLQPSASSVFTIEEEVTFAPLPDIERFRNKESRNISCQLPLATVPLLEVDKLTDWLSKKLKLLLFLCTEGEYRSPYL
jgi:hypothetical protein